MAAGVVAKAPCPVLVIPENYAFKGFSQVAYASELLEEDPFELWQAMQLIEPANPLVHCIHFNLGDETIWKLPKKMDRLKAFYKEKHAWHTGQVSPFAWRRPHPGPQ